MGTLIAPAEIAIAGSRTLWGVTGRSDPLGGRGDPFRGRGQALRGGRRCTTEVIPAATTTAAKTSSPAKVPTSATMEAATSSATMEAATSSATAPSHGRGEANAKG